jgi:hypothetical protein
MGGADRITKEEWTYIRKFVDVLKNPHCQPDDHAKQSLKDFLEKEFTPELTQLWEVPPNRRRKRSLIQESKIPCDSSAWVSDGLWQTVSDIH